MELKRFFRVLYKKLCIVILLPLVVSGITAFFSFFILKPVYESYTTLYIVNEMPAYGANASYEELLISRQLVRDYNEIIKSRTVTSQIINELELTDLDHETLVKRIKMNLKGETSVIEIRVEDTIPSRAQRIADKVTDIFVGKLEELIQVDSVNIIDTPKVPEEPARPKPALLTLISFFAGLFIAISLAFFADYMDDTIETPEDVEKYLGLPVLGMIPMVDSKQGGLR